MPKRNDYPIGSNIERIPVPFGGEQEGMTPELRDYIATAVDELPDEYRMIVEMRLWQQLPFRLIARNLGYKSHASIVTKYSEALDMIRREISEDYTTNTG